MKIMPSTNIPVIDEYYRNVDTGGLVDRIVFKSEFDRLRAKIETLWHTHRTPASETERVGQKLSRILSQNLESDKSSQAKGLFLMERYISHVRKYYESETWVTSLYEQRARLLQEFVLKTVNCVDITVFEFLAVRMALQVRLLGIKLVNAVKHWKSQLRRATATFYV